MGIFSMLFGASQSRSGQVEVLGRDLDIYQIVYDEGTRQSCDQYFIPLENSVCERPDWFEYWPIQKFLQCEELDEQTWYGFLSPRFFDKTGLRGMAVRDFIARSPEADVYIFSPFPCHGTFFLNVFEHGNFFDPGFGSAAQATLDCCNIQVDLTRLVNHSGNVIFSNYFLARPRFWREWLRVCSAVYQVSEHDVLGAQLRVGIDYWKENGVRSVVERKVFLMERIASLILASSQEFSSVSYPIEKIPVSLAGRPFVDRIQPLDDIKKKLAAEYSPELLELYRNEQRQIVEQAWPGGHL